MSIVDHLDKLKAFKTILEAGTMKKAARELHVTQPSLTRLVQTLEEASGVKLVTTGRGGVAATEAGTLLLEFSSSILKSLEDLEAKLQNPGDRLSGHLTIGSYETLAEYLWPDFLVDFQKHCPNLRISVRTSQSVSHSKALEEGQLDLLVDAEPRISGDLMSWRLYEDRFQVYGRREARERLRDESGMDLPIIYCPNAFDRHNKAVIRYLEEAGYLFKQKIELDSFPAVRSFCLKGVGVGIMPMRLAESSARAKGLVPVPLKGVPAQGFGAHDIVATARSNRADDPRIRLLVKSLRAWFRK